MLWRPVSPITTATRRRGDSVQFPSASPWVDPRNIPVLSILFFDPAAQMRFRHTLAPALHWEHKPELCSGEGSTLPNESVSPGQYAIRGLPSSRILRFVCFLIAHVPKRALHASDGPYIDEDEPAYLGGSMPSLHGSGEMWWEA